MKTKKGKESFIVKKEDLDDFSKTSGSWKIEGETYKYIDRKLVKGNGGECYDVLTKRKSDGKYFSFTWEYDGDEYYYYEDWEEVFPKKIETVVWK